MIETIAQLEHYLEEECYSFLFLTIGRHRAPEGIFIDTSGDRFIYGFSERGHQEILRSFSTEQELVAYALKDLQSDPWNRAHLAAWVWSEAEILAAEQELRQRGIPFRRNDIPSYRPGQRAYRIFVFGRDILRLGDFPEKYRRH